MRKQGTKGIVGIQARFEGNIQVAGRGKQGFFKQIKKQRK